MRWLANAEISNFRQLQTNWVSIQTYWDDQMAGVADIFFFFRLISRFAKKVHRTQMWRGCFSVQSDKKQSRVSHRRNKWMARCERAKGRWQKHMWALCSLHEKLASLHWYIRSELKYRWTCDMFFIRHAGDQRLLWVVSWIYPPRVKVGIPKLDSWVPWRIIPGRVHGYVII